MLPKLREETGNQGLMAHFIVQCPDKEKQPLQPLEPTPDDQQRSHNPCQHDQYSCLDGSPASTIVDDLPQGIIQVVERHGVDQRLQEVGCAVDVKVGATQEHHGKTDQQDE